MYKSSRKMVSKLPFEKSLKTAPSKKRKEETNS